jgi:hypothetical protein
VQVTDLSARASLRPRPRQWAGARRNSTRIQPARRRPGGPSWIAIHLLVFAYLVLSACGGGDPSSPAPSTQNGGAAGASEAGPKLPDVKFRGDRISFVVNGAFMSLGQFQASIPLELGSTCSGTLYVVHSNAIPIAGSAFSFQQSNGSDKADVRGRFTSPTHAEVDIDYTGVAEQCGSKSYGGKQSYTADAEGAGGDAGGDAGPQEDAGAAEGSGSESELGSQPEQE